MIRRRMLIPLLVFVTAVALTTTANAGPKEIKESDPDTILKDIKDGRGKKIKEAVRYTGVWDGCKFHYLKSRMTTYTLDGDATVANIIDDPEPLPPKERGCVATRNPTRAEMDEMDARIAKLNPYVPAPGAPPTLPLPPDRYRGTP